MRPSCVRVLLALCSVIIAAFALMREAAAASDAPNEPTFDFEQLYPATRSWSRVGLAPVANAEDVWRLRSFSLALGDDLAVSTEGATLVLGHDGTDVLWAVLLPDTPPALRGGLAPEGERAASITLRFPPADVGQLFPATTVDGRSDPLRRHEAARIARRKMVWKWCTPAGNPTIVPPGVVIVDVDTAEGPRRFWAADRNAGKVVRLDDFAGQATPSPAPIDRATAEAAFDAVWSAFDREYAGFVELPELDWNAQRERWRPQAAAAESNFALAAVLAEMLATLEDLHVWVRCGDDFLQGCTRERPLNGDWQATRSRLTEVHEAGRNLVWGRFEGDVGYLGIHGLSDRALPDQVDAALDALRDTKGLVVDLRFNGGGDETLGRAVAGRFAADRQVYSRSRFRNGPSHEDLGPPIDRVLEPRGPWRYDKPVVCLVGRGTLSSAESTAAMFAQCPDVVTLGSPTGGSSGNPRRIELECGIVVNLPRWLDLLPDGTALERRGLAPDILVERPREAFTPESDPVLEAALKRLRSELR